jgi:hypothetical protein
MLRVTIELLPRGSEEGKRTLGVLEIANDATGGEYIGNYDAKLVAEYGTRHGRVRSFHRQSQSAWSLVGAFLKLFGHTKHSPTLMEEDKKKREFEPDNTELSSLF